MKLNNIETTSYQLLTMIGLQDRFNKHVYPDWKTKHFAWDTAVFVECGELIDHIGYKWWKKQTPNKEQVVLELVDIWHFYLSIVMEHWDAHDFVKCFQNNYEGVKINVDNVPFMDTLYDNVSKTTLINCVKSFSIDILQGNFNSSVKLFINLMSYMGLTLDELYTMYVSKNALNYFRQKNGYKEGTYIKNWNGREDNEVLSEIINLLISDKNEDYNTGLFDKIMIALSNEYNKLNHI